MRTDECFKNRLLRKDRPDPLKAKKGMEMADIKYERANEL
jgi:hypothetical protein